FSLTARCPTRWTTPQSVSEAGFEPALSCSQGRRVEPGYATRSDLFSRDGWTQPAFSWFRTRRALQPTPHRASHFQGAFFGPAGSRQPLIFPLPPGDMPPRLLKYRFGVEAPGTPLLQERGTEVTTALLLGYYQDLPERASGESAQAWRRR